MLTSSAQTQESAAARRPIKVLIADDNREFCQILSEYLAGVGDFHVAGIANDGKEVLELLEAEPVDVILLDIIMPYLDGIGVLERLPVKSGSGRPKIITLTAFGQENVSQRVSELGANYFVLKPFNLDVLAERIRQVVWSQPSQPVSQSGGRDVEAEVTSLLHKVGIPAHIKGYGYLREGIMLVIEKTELLGAVTKELYPAVADRFDTTPSRVERAIRHAIEVAWNRGDMEVVERLFGHTIHSQRGKPTNSEFIAMVADKFRISMRQRS